jgi:OHCU decarboxylase
MSDKYPRDMTGYGSTPPVAGWPGDARIAVQFVINYEEGGENNILHGDAGSEAFLSEIVGASSWPGQRHMNMESIYEYGSRAGFWRLSRLFNERSIPVTVFAVASALEKNPDVVTAMQTSGWEIASHGLKWIDYKDFDKEDERIHMVEALRIHEDITGAQPLGWYTGRNSENTLDLVMEQGGLLYSADSYADDLPYWIKGASGPHLIVPYTLDANDMRFATPQGFNSGDQFYSYLKDTFDVLYAEGKAGLPKMMSIGLHCRLAGRPGRAAALARFLDYVGEHEKVWLARRCDIARHWLVHHAPEGLIPEHMTEVQFVQYLADIFEHSPWIPQRAHAAALNASANTAGGLMDAFSVVLDSASDDERLALINAHPDLAGKLAMARELTDDSTKEQASAGLDILSTDEVSRFNELNDAYKARFNFPFIMAIKGTHKDDILAAFESRLQNDQADEFETAIEQIKKIARLRLDDRLP